MTFAYATSVARTSAVLAIYPGRPFAGSMPRPWRLGEHYGIGRHFADILDARGQVIARVRVSELRGTERVPYAPGLELAARILAMGKVAD